MGGAEECGRLNFLSGGDRKIYVVCGKGALLYGK